jgi:hypothetical protein
MNIWKYLPASILLLAAGLAHAQVRPPESVMAADEAAFRKLPKLVMPVEYSTRPLPSKKDNTRLTYFPGIYSQQVWNCNQASSVWTLFTYEINYLRGLSSTDPENQYSPMAVYNLLNYGFSTQGVSYFDSWNLIKANGIPGNMDFSAYNQNWQTWMTGYDKYYRGMQNRVDQVYAIDVGTPEGLLTLKHWINDHLNGSAVGGLANFQIGSGDMVIPQIPLDKGLEEEGQYIITKYGPWVGHAMTFAGWNDSIRYDVNGDGRYTNNIDINGDGVVNMKDWEIGAMLVVNSWGPGWGNAGKIWVMDRLLAETPEEGGIWNQAAMVAVPKKTYSPLLTVKTQIRYNQRNRLKIQVGVASDPQATVPEKTMDYPCFSFQGDTLPMQGFVGVDSDLIEIGLDITPLMNDIPDNGQARIFMEVVQRSTDNKASGRIESFSVMNYTSGSGEFVSTEIPATITRNSVTRVSVPISVAVNRPQILTDELPGGMVGLDYRVQIEADGTTGPYRYENPKNTYRESADDSSPGFSGGTKVFNEPGISSRVMDLPFTFPFYDSTYTQVTVLADGGVVMGQHLVIYPYVIDNRLRFYQNEGIFPFMGILFYPNATFGVTFEATADEAVIRWHASTDFSGTRPVEFAATLFPDGRVGIHYGNMSVPPDLAWITGLSAGNNLDYHRLGNNETGILPNTSFCLSKMEWPAWLRLASNGDLQGTPLHSGTYTLPLKVTDWNGLSSTKTLTLNVTGGSATHPEALAATVEAFPNPVTDRLMLKGTATRNGTVTLILYDLAGHPVVEKSFEGRAGNVLIPVEETRTLPAGTYLYRLTGILEGSGKIIRQ